MATIGDANRRFLGELAARLAHWHANCCVGDVFGSIEAMLPHYTAYIQNYTEAVRVLKQAQRKRKVFKEFLARQKLDPRGQWRGFVSLFCLFACSVF